MMANFEDDLFSLLWTEIDFDDHPICGGHGSEPEGELEISVNENCIIINDNRIEMILAHPDAFHNEGIEKLLSVSENSRKVASAISEMSCICWSAVMAASHRTAKSTSLSRCAVPAATEPKT